MITVVDQHNPWLTPSSTLANTIQLQLGAQMMSSGTGSPASQPATSSGLRPSRSASRPAKRFANAFTTPKLTRKERTTVLETRPKSASAIRGTTVRSSPTIAPKKALKTTSSANWRQLAPRPSRISGDGAAIGARLQLARVVGQSARFVQSDNAVMVRWCRRDPGEDLAHERVLRLVQQRSPLPDLSQGRADGPPVERHGRARVRGQHDGVRWQLHQAPQRSVKEMGTAARLLGRRLEIGPAHCSEEQR